jgi:hypothetical protein
MDNLSSKTISEFSYQKINYVHGYITENYFEDPDIQEIIQDEC